MTEIQDRIILVTGGSGFIGSALVTELARLGAEVHAVSRRESKNTGNAVWHYGDLSNYSFVDNLIESVRPDFVFHLAGHVVGLRDVSQVIPTLNSNLISTVNVLVALNKYGCKRMILSGSLEEPRVGEQALLPSSPYAASKFAASGYSMMFHELYKLPVTIARIHMGYGPGMQNMKKLLPYLILTAQKGETPKLSSGTRKLDWIYIDDIVSGLIHMVVAEGIDGQTIELGTGKLTSIREIAELTVSMVNPDIMPEFGALEDRPLEQESKTNIEETFNKTGWRAETDLNQGLEKMIVSFSDNKSVSKKKKTSQA